MPSEAKRCRSLEGPRLGETFPRTFLTTARAPRPAAICPYGDRTGLAHARNQLAGDGTRFEACESGFAAAITSVNAAENPQLRLAHGVKNFARDLVDLGEYLRRQLDL